MLEEFWLGQALMGLEYGPGEAAELATQMLQEVKAVAPHLFEKAGPPCLRGACPEGKMSCGQMAQVREKFQAL